VTGTLSVSGVATLGAGAILNTPASGTLTNATGLPISTGVSGLGTGVATFLATPSSANLLAAVTNETGTGALVFGTSPTLTTPISATLTSPAATNLTLAGGTAGSDSVVVSNTLSASSAIIGAFKVGNGTAATNVAIGGGNLNAGGTGTFGVPMNVGTTPKVVVAATKTINGSGEFSGGLAVQDFTDGSGTTGGGGVLTFEGNSGGGVLKQYAAISGFKEIATATDFGSALAFYTRPSGGSLTERARIDKGGTVSISSSTAGSSNAGALVVTGGLATGAASYFGGAVTTTGTLTVGAGTSAFNVGNSGQLTVASNGAATDTPLQISNTAQNWQLRLNGSNSALWFYNVTGGSVPLVLSSTGAATFAGTVIAPAATASLAPLRIPHGTAPTSPTNGDMWTTTAGLYIRINGATVGPLS
jgi:hypothetical protein